MAKLQGIAKRDARSTRIAAAVFLFPAVALLVVYMIYPIIDTFLISRLNGTGSIRLKRSMSDGIIGQR